jgi:FlaA1/EpsC-like NDP-sugar epimerase
MFHRIVTQHNIEQVLISTPRISHERITEILRECESQNIELKRMAITIENIGEPELAVSPLTEKGP